MCKQTFPGHESDINAVTVRCLSHFGRIPVLAVVLHDLFSFDYA